MADYNIRLGVIVDTNNIQAQINSATNNVQPIRVTIDTNHTQRQVERIRSQIQSLNNTRINIGNITGGGGIGRAGGSIANINNNISQITTTANNATNTIRRLRQTLASANFDNGSIDLVTRHLEQMSLSITNVTSRLRHNNLRLNITGTDELGRTVTVLKEINLATGQITNIGKNISQSFGRSREEINQTNAAYREMKSLIGQIAKTSININNARAAGQEFGALEHKLAALNARYDELEANFAGGFDHNQTRNLSNQWSKVAHDINIANEAITNARAGLARGINIKLNNGSFTKEITDITSKFDSIKNKSQELRNAMANLNSAYGRVQTASASGNINELISANEEYLRVLKQVQNQLGINATAEKNANAQQKLANDRMVFQSKIDAWLTRNSAATKKFGAAMLNLKAQAESCDRVTLGNLQSQFEILDNQAEKAGLKMQSFGDKLEAQISRYSQYFSVYTAVMYATRALRDMFNQVVAIDTAMTELKKVTNETDAAYNQFLSNASERAKEIGTTIDGLVNSTADFARLGYSFKESQGLAEVANIYAVVGDEVEGVEGATQSLISTMTAFKDEMNGMSDSDFAMSIIDKMNEVGNNFAISSGGIGEALQRSASSMAAANNTLDETIALITASNEVAQNPEKVGNALKTISMRIRGAKTE